jgi:hypothetical protein
VRTNPPIERIDFRHSHTATRPDVPEWARTQEEHDLIEMGRIDNWIRELEAGESPPEPNPIPAEWSSVPEVAARHGLSPKTIRKAIRDGRLKAVDQGGVDDPRARRYRIHRDAEGDWIADRGGRKRERAARSAVTSPTGKSFREMVQK